MTTKTTKKDNYNTLLELVAIVRDHDFDGYDFQGLEDFLNKEIEGLDKKAEAARKRAAKKKGEGDEMRETLYGLLTTVPQTIPELLLKMQDAMNDTTISAQKLTARLKQLVDLGRVEKSEKSVEGPEGTKARKLTAYAVVDAEAEGVDEG